MRSQIYYKSQPYFNKSIIFNGVRYDSIGGIHSDDTSGIFIKDSSTSIIDCDIASMYPNLIINNNLYPAHLSKTFLTLYKKIIDQEWKLKKSGKIQKHMY
jgi:DNA polymerase elongation subunit (family B)